MKFCRKGIDYSDVNYLFIFLSVYFIIVPYLFEITCLRSLVTFLALIGCISYLCGASHKKFCRLHYRHESAYINKLFLFLGVIFSMSDFIVGLVNLMKAKATLDYTSSYQVADYDSLYVQIIELSLVTAKYYLYALLISRGKKLFWFVFITQIVFFLNSPTRLVALYPFIVLALYGYRMSYLRVTVFRLFIIVCIAPVLFVILLLSRTESESTNYFDKIYGIFEMMSFESFVNILRVALESFQSYEYLVLIVQEQLVKFDSGIVRLIFMPVSRGIWEDKPESISRVISYNYNPGQYFNGGGSVATIYGDAFINGHVFGLVLILFCLGYISRLIYNTATNNITISKNQKSTLYMFYSLFFYQFIYYFRGFFSESYWKLIVIIVVFYGLYFVQYKSGFGCKGNV